MTESIFCSYMNKKYPTIRYKEYFRQMALVYRRWQLRVLIYLIACLVLSGLAMLFVSDSIWSADWWFGLVATFLLAMIVVAYIPFVRNRVSIMACYGPVSQGFAKENNFTYIEKRVPKHSKLFRPSIEGTGL